MKTLCGGGQNRLKQANLDAYKVIRKIDAYKVIRKWNILCSSPASQNSTLKIVRILENSVAIWWRKLEHFILVLVQIICGDSLLYIEIYNVSEIIKAETSDDNY